MPDRLVIDASVVAKSFLSDEADKGAADKLLLLLLSDEIEMSAPGAARERRAEKVERRRTGTEYSVRSQSGCSTSPP